MPNLTENNPDQESIVSNIFMGIVALSGSLILMSMAFFKSRKEKRKDRD